MRDAGSETVAGSGPGAARRTQIYPLNVTLQERSTDPGPGRADRSTLHFLDEPAAGRRGPRVLPRLGSHAHPRSRSEERGRSSGPCAAPCTTAGPATRRDATGVPSGGAGGDRTHDQGIMSPVL